MRSARIASSRRRRSRSEANNHIVAEYAPDRWRTIPPAAPRAAHSRAAQKPRQNCRPPHAGKPKGNSSQNTHFWWLAPYSLGRPFGVYLPELMFLARSVFITDAEGVIQHVDIVSEFTHEPEYDAAIDVLAEML